MENAPIKDSNNQDIRDMFFPVKKNDIFIVRLIKNILFYGIAGIMGIALLIMFSLVLLVA